MKAVSFMLCAWFTLMTSCWRAVTLHLKKCLSQHQQFVRMGKVGVTSVHTVRRTNTQACDKHIGTWRGFEIRFTECAKEISIITLPSHRRRDRKFQITPLELSQLRALNGPLLWLGVQCLPQLLAPLSLLMGQTPQATVGTIYEVNKLARKATGWARTPLKILAHHSPVVVTYTDAGRTTRPDGTSQGGQLVFIAISELLQGRESTMSLISWHSSRLKQVARSSSAAETQAAADGGDEAVYIRLCLGDVLFGQLELQNWQSETRQILAALVVDCRGVYDAMARSSSSYVGLKDKKSGLEALALKQSLVECETMIRWCHSAAQLRDVVTIDSDAARAPWELFVRRGFPWKLTIPSLNPRDTVQNVDLTFWKNLMITSLQTTFHEIRRVSR